ncbi:uncharacterized membrane protein YhaH (DUF805 family) [Rhizomicrobium palustre]|uniref:Uncharacterized membrane protein YhaH (DUF805 family) n=1 Tax=Rhizomicrobium palustre TaxID=189966 RepID=A0A846N4A2_9PROT|nr:DUF805 domain-containing protein [Rhizomicrobium palustre]NIK89880.1 uncharacterized membrane protein YhaH (DUF805 family) [Rhizomicrobium palustre]
MPILSALLIAMQKAFDFSGRAGRLEFWSFASFWLLVAVFAAKAFHLPPAPALSLDWSLRALGAAPVLLLPAALLVPFAAVAVRRLHDVGLSGWWLLTATAPVPILDLLVIGTQIVCFAKKGTAGDNRYGPDPLAARGDMQPAFDSGTL